MPRRAAAGSAGGGFGADDAGRAARGSGGAGGGDGRGGREGQGEGGGDGAGEEEAGERDHQAQAYLARAAGVRRRRRGAAADRGHQARLGAHQGQQPPGSIPTPSLSSLSMTAC